MPIGESTLAANVFAAHVRYLKALLTRGGGSIDERDGIFLYQSPAPLPFLVNGVARTDPSVAAATVLDAAAGVFGDRGFELLCLEGRDDDLRAAAEAAGFQTGSPDPLQHIARLPEPAPGDHSAFDVRLAEDVVDVRDIVAIAQDAHTVYKFPDAFFPELFRVPESILAPDVRAVIVSRQGAPVATAQAFLTGSTVYIGWVAVVPAAARRGLGWLATREAVAAGLSSGGKEAVLLASPMGAPLYRAMGFTDVGALRNAQAPSSPHH